MNSDWGIVILVFESVSDKLLKFPLKVLPSKDDTLLMTLAATWNRVVAYDINESSPVMGINEPNLSSSTRILFGGELNQ